MFRPRLIPVLLLKNNGLVKSTRFKAHQYIGDPINAVRLFNDKLADEIIFLDIDASREQRLISLDFVKKVGDEASMPFAVGGGIRTIDDIRKVINMGAEKVVLGSVAQENPSFIEQAANTYGSSTISVCIDVKKAMLGRYSVRYQNGRYKSRYGLLDFVKQAEEFGVGELIIQSVDRDGTYKGYDINLINAVTSLSTVPVVALGGASNFNDFRNAFVDAKASALAAGSLFVYQSQHKGVLINYPSQDRIQELWR